MAEEKSLLGPRSAPAPSSGLLEPPMGKRIPRTSNLNLEVLKKHFTLESLVGGGSACECGASLSNNITIVDMESDHKICLDCLGGWKVRKGTDVDSIVNYYVLPALTFPLFTRQWTARQELELL